ncbi:MAG TPA: hypothetical protein VMB04_12050 [Mycobacterium sp.]|nr:hypothetical protein [Mycobacterium sp.]
MSEPDESRSYQIEVSKTTHLHFDVDEEKIAAIRACLAKGRLSISVTDVDLTEGGRLESAYLYD